MNDAQYVDLLKRIENIVRFGVVVSVDYAARHAVVQYASGEQSAPLPWCVRRANVNGEAEWWPIEPGEAVLVLSPGGVRATGRIVPAATTAETGAPAANADKHVIRHADGARFEYDRAANHWDIDLPSGTARLSAPNGVAIIGDLRVDGNIKASGDITDKTRSMAADRAIYNAHDHVETGAKTKLPSAQQ